MSLSVSVPEAAATPDSIQFKLVVDGTVSNRANIETRSIH
jgi:hypothetical protein